MKNDEKYYESLISELRLFKEKKNLVPKKQTANEESQNTILPRTGPRYGFNKEVFSDEKAAMKEILRDSKEALSVLESMSYFINPESYSFRKFNKLIAHIDVISSRFKSKEAMTIFDSANRIVEDLFNYIDDTSYYYNDMHDQLMKIIRIAYDY